MPLITDGRFSGASHGIMIGHVTPEAFDGGHLALVENGDIIVIDSANNSLSVEVSDEEFNRRKVNWTLPAHLTELPRGVLKKFRKNVASAHFGATTS